MPGPPSDLREYLAAERTLLAYLRTGLSMMGIGFVVARFGLVLRIMQTNFPSGSSTSSGRSHWIGVALVVLGSAVSVLSAAQYWTQVGQLNTRLREDASASWLALSLALVMASIGVALALYLLASTQ